MTSVENLSDADIRLKLAELGYPVGPITATTRKTLVKKLKNLLDQPSSKSYQSLAKHSSGEESEDDNNTAGRTRRAMPPPPPKSAQKTVKRKSVSRRSQDVDSSDDFDVSSVSTFQQPRASSTHYPGVNSEAETSSLKYSPKNIVSPPSNRPITPERKSVSSSFQSRFIKQTVNKSPESFESGSDTDGLDELEGISNKNIHSPARPTSTGLFSAFKTNFSPAPTQARSRFQPQTYVSPKQEIFSPRLSPKSGSNNDANNHASPFSSDFARRLSVTSPFRQSQATATSGGLSSRLLDVKESDDEDGNSRPSYSHQSPGYLRGGPSVLPEVKIWKNGSSISFVLLFIVAIFFCGLAVMYLNMRFKEVDIKAADTVFPICKQGDKPGSNCLISTEVQQSMAMFREVYRVVHDRAVDAACGAADSAELTQEQLAQIIVEQKQLSLWDVEKHIGNIRVLISANPQWGVRVENNKFSLPEPSLPFSCVASNILFGIVGSIMRLFVGQ